MSLGTTNRDGGKTSESGHLRAIYKALIAEVLIGLNVSQRGAGANMSVDIAIGDAVLPRSDATYGHPVFNDAVLNKTVTTADPSNPRRDIVIMYLDYTVTPSTGVSNNTNGVVLTKVVAGTPAGSPADPSSASLQAAAGSGNPYIKLARIRVGAGVTSIGNSVIDDLRKMANGLIQGGWIYDPTYDWVYASAGSFTIAGVDLTAQFPAGTKLAVYQSGAIKYFVVTGSAFSTNTTVSITGTGTTTLANVPIDKPAYSYAERPVGFPAGNGFCPYKFDAYMSATFTYTANTPYIMVFQTKRFDTGTNYSTSTGRFTAPVAGFYQFNWNTGVSAVTPSILFASIYKNGVEFARSTDIRANALGVAGSSLIQLAAGDYVDIRTYNNASSGDYSGGGTGALTKFSGFLVSLI